MKKLKNLIEHIFTKKNIKIFLLLFVVVWFFVWVSFAASSDTSSLTPVKRVSHLLNVVISILSWGWVILATMAWKLMTNEFVYGSFLHLDMILWQLWNMMKNFANFTLWVLLIFTIVKNLFKWSCGGSGDDPMQGAVKTIKSTLIAWVLIQMSRFLMAAVLDLSTIATAAVWALPSQFMASSTSFQNDMRGLLSNANTKLEIDLSTDWDIVDVVRTGVNTDEEIQRILDTVTPNTESMAWPLIFLWASVFNLYDLSDSSKNLSGTDDIWDLILSLWINWFVLLSFSLMMALIFLFNLFRVITLWIIIPLMPFVMLLNVFKKTEIINKIGGSKLGGMLDYGKILKLVFKPVYMTLVLSIVLIVMVLVRTLAKANWWALDLQKQSNMTIESVMDNSDENDPKYISSLDISNIAKIKMVMKESIVDLLVYIMGIALMFMLMKSCVSGELTGIKFIDDRVNSLSASIWWSDKEKLWWILGSVWVIPVPGGWKVGISKLREFREQKLNDYTTWASAAWIDLAKQDRLVDERLGWWSFVALGNRSLTKSQWIDIAVEKWRSGKYKDATEMFRRNDEFAKRFNEWNAHWRWNKEGKTISLPEIDEVWKWDESSQWWDEWWNTPASNNPQTSSS